MRAYDLPVQHEYTSLKTVSCEYSSVISSVGCVQRFHPSQNQILSYISLTEQGVRD